MPTDNTTTQWELRVLFTDIHAVVCCGPDRDEGYAGDLYLSLGQLTAANDSLMEDAGWAPPRR